MSRGITVKEYFGKMAQARHEMEAMKPKLAEMKNMAGYGEELPAVNAGVPAELTSKAEEVARLSAEYEEMEQEANSLIDELTDDRARRVIRRRYFEGWSWENIADKEDVALSAVVDIVIDSMETIRRRYYFRFDAVSINKFKYNVTN